MIPRFGESSSYPTIICRLHYVKRVAMQKKRDVALLKSRLDVYNDEWRTAQPDPDVKVKLPSNAVPPTEKVRKPRMRKGEREQQEQTQSQGDAGTAANKTPDNLNNSIGQKGMGKRKRTKSDKVQFDH